MLTCSLRPSDAGNYRKVSFFLVFCGSGITCTSQKRDFYDQDIDLGRIDTFLSLIPTLGQSLDENIVPETGSIYLVYFTFPTQNITLIVKRFVKCVESMYSLTRAVSKV